MMILKKFNSVNEIKVFFIDKIKRQSVVTSPSYPIKIPGVAHRSHAPKKKKPNLHVH